MSKQKDYQVTLDLTFMPYSGYNYDKGYDRNHLLTSYGSFLTHGMQGSFVPTHQLDQFRSIL